MNSPDSKDACCGGGGCSDSGTATLEQPTIPAKFAPVDQPDLPGFRTDNREMQTRFHFHMDLCVGCHACEVACAEQNNLPAHTQWRRVGEVQSGTFPDTQSYFLSSGCNHCLDAACAKGCPVDAYEINDKGIVVHLDDVCIGCGYCTWNCPYSVPKLQPDRRIVTKCDMCHNRLADGQDPACVQACPAGAIEIETVPLAQIYAEHMENGVGPDMPNPNITIPSTK
ncbi:4Fe-4S dicluster domain-containing protein, partial [Pontiella sp.]|uniref:4Fe-4S dicluster domain-containing protein n=1 Tax=Pontiella sp. TaxID=2837462 RepID=UPI003564749D